MSRLIARRGRVNGPACIGAVFLSVKAVVAAPSGWARLRPVSVASVGAWGGQKLGASGMSMRRKRCSLLAAFIGTALAIAVPWKANAVCMVTPTGTVNCNADTTTTDTTNTDGGTVASSNRQQVFNNGAAINATVQSGVTVSGFGLQLTEGSAAAQSITMQNRGLVTTGNAVNALQLDGNGGLITYSGDGSVTNTNASGGALSVDNVSGNVSITTGAGAIRGATGINASTTGAGALTISTGSGLVSGMSGTAGQSIVASTVNGALSVTIGSGGVTSVGNNPAVDLTTTNGNISVTANGNVSANGGSASIDSKRSEISHGILAVSNGLGNIVVDGSGTVFGAAGRGIYALESTTGLGGILVTGTGDTISGTTTSGCCSAIRAEIANPANSSNIIVNRSGNLTSFTTPSLPATSGIHAITVGAGNIIVASGVGSTITSPDQFGINAQARGQASSGSINVSTGTFGTINAGGTGIFAVNSAFAIPASADSTIAVTNNGTINSGPIPNQAVIGVSELGVAPTANPAGILAGYTGCSGCTVLTPNPNVNGTVSVVNNAAINAAGDGIFAFNFGNGNVSVISSAPITVTGATSQNGIEALSGNGTVTVTISNNIAAAQGNGIQTSSAGGATTIDVNAGTTQGTTSGITAASTGGPIQINNAATIQNMSGLAGDLAVATSGTGSATLTNNAGAVVNGSVSMAGTGTNTFTNAGIWNTLGTSTFAGYSSINNSGTINVLGPTTFSGLTILTNGGILSLTAGGGAINTLTITGNLAFQSGAMYLIQVTASSASSTNITGTATLDGIVQAAFAPGSYVARQYTILHSAGLGGTSFAALSTSNLPANFSANLNYTATDVLLNLVADLGGGLDGLSQNQINVANAINNFFNTGAALPSNFGALFGLTGGNLANALMLLSGEVATGEQQGAFKLMDQFLALMFDPFLDGRAGVGGIDSAVMGFAADREPLPDDLALAYAKVLRSPVYKAPTFEQRWSVWGAGYGGYSKTGGDPVVVGSHELSARAAGFAAGMDYRVAPGAVLGFALAGGGTGWSLAQGLGSGKSDAFQAGAYGVLWGGPAYVAASLAYTNHWMSTDRYAAFGDHLAADFSARSFGGRVESGYRLPSLVGAFTPYAAVQAQSFHTPSYNETDITGGGFGLSYNGRSAGDTRSELGARYDKQMLINYGAVLAWRGRLAWAHDWISDPSLTPAFQALPGAGFIVNGATPAKNSVLASAGAELRLIKGVSLLGKFDGEFASRSQTYAGTGMVRYTW
jgi:uncharacterized protein with beta-barrel porin domain